LKDVISSLDKFASFLYNFIGKLLHQMIPGVLHWWLWRESKWDS